MAYSGRGPGLISQYLDGSSQQSVTPAPENLTPSFLACKTSAPMWCT